MDAIKKKMQAMKIEKENALDKSEQLDQKLRDVEEAKAKVCSFFLVFTCLSCVTKPFLFRKVIPKSAGFSATKNSKILSWKFQFSSVFFYSNPLSPMLLWCNCS